MKKIIILALALMVSAPHTALAVGDGTESSPVEAAPAASSLATYNGKTIDLTDGWGTAHACVVQDSGTNCFDTEQQMNEFMRASGVQTVGFKSSARRAVCGSSLYLYDGISYTLNVLALTSRYVVLNLSAYGFDNATTSYKIGGCSSSMWNGSGAGGSLYPGNTAAWAQSPSMVTGWNNTMSSVYIG